MSINALIKAVIPQFVRDEIYRRRFLFLYENHYNRNLTNLIKANNFLSEKMVADVMRKHKLGCRWASVYSAMNGIVSRDYVSNGFFFSQIQPRMNPVKFVDSYTDKNFYDTLPFREYTPLAIARKISGRYFDNEYNSLSDQALEEKLKRYNGDLVIKPAIESGSGKNIWIGPSAEAYSELISRTQTKDIIVQECLRGNDFSKRLNPTSFNTVRVMTGFTGSEHVVLGSALRMGFLGSRVDNMTAGGLIVGIRADGSLYDFAVDKNFNKYESHPHIPFIFKNESVPGYQDIAAVCLRMHRYLPHFGIVSWDAAIDDKGRIRIVEYNLDWQGINILQIPHGPLFGIYKDQFKKTYGLPDWEK